MQRYTVAKVYIDLQKNILAIYMYMCVYMLHLLVCWMK